MKYFAHESAYVDEGAQVGEDSKIWHYSHIMPKAVIGKGCNLGQNVFVANNVTIGNAVKIQNNVSVYEGVVLEDYVFCGPSMVFTNVKNPRGNVARNTSDDYFKTVVRTGATLGANSTIVCGVSIGKFAFVGAGAVVTKDVPDYALMLGAPAKVSGFACECGEVLTRSVEPGEVKCQSCDRAYRSAGASIEKIAGA